MGNLFSKLLFFRNYDKDVTGISTLVLSKITSVTILQYLNNNERQILRLYKYALILNFGEIIFKGAVIIGAVIIDNFGQIIFEGETLAGEGTTFIIRKRLYIGKYARIGFQSFFIDNDAHYYDKYSKRRSKK
ncbi:MAG: hypothetical protein LBP72_04860 [Dysgonamonadaceae bacterium]|jgi:hypothetical protein|nr:hypothetical protein [Dysgonamonadaceae bacterium]